VQVRDLQDAQRFLQHEEDRAVLDEAEPVALAYELRLFLGQARIAAAFRLVAQELLAECRLREAPEELVDAHVRDALRHVERVRAVQLGQALKLRIQALWLPKTRRAPRRAPPSWRCW